MSALRDDDASRVTIVMTVPEALILHHALKAVLQKNRHQQFINDQQETLIDELVFQIAFCVR